MYQDTTNSPSKSNIVKESNDSPNLGLSESPLVRYQGEFNSRGVPGSISLDQNGVVS